ncbi:hypothetical protein BOTNAR_0314g00040 [Botryotinia narcissicola]|uniref:CFEM domain-containing protein n=1 Tax=Botryotinia narcissicola TaxID=278944 RepID=A0A4Z1HUZ2_9HELO|nr:hypothetical protein BOTNAR_0314g00040 [Botryotinia narcissicola]
MQFTIVSVLAHTSLALAQDSGIPACAQSCIDDAVKSETTCGATDKACQCLPDNVSSIQNAATTCVISSCGITVALTVPAAAAAACAALPASSAAPSSSAVETSSSAAAPSSSAAESSPVVSSTAASTPVSSHASTPVSSVVATTVTSGVAAPTGGSGSNATATGPSPTSSTVPYTGAGAQVKASFAGALVLGVAAVFAF